jgi:hypothetical protein
VARSAHPTIEKAKKEAEARFRELIDELKILTVAFPHLQDAYDPEDLPISFIMKRDAARAARPARRAAAAAAKTAARAQRKKKA